MDFFGSPKTFNHLFRCDWTQIFKVVPNVPLIPGWFTFFPPAVY